jgi:hypothetical protein
MRKLETFQLHSSGAFLTRRNRGFVRDSKDRIEWLSFRGGDDVLDTYAALFPRSVLPRYCRVAFWTVIVSAAIVLCAMTMLKAFGR